MNGLAGAHSEEDTPPLGSHGYHRTSRKASPGHSDRSNSPVSRTDTPGLPSIHQHNSNIAPQHMFDSVALAEQSLNHHNGHPSLQFRQPSPTSSSAMDRHLDGPQSYERLLAANTKLNTRVSELEVINELFRGRVAELEQSDATARRSEMIVRDSEVRLRRSLEESQRREEDLKRHLSDLESQLGERTHNGDGQNESSGEPLAKRVKLSDVVELPSKSPQSI